MSTPNLRAWADALVPVAEEAGRAILEIQRSAFTVDAKADNSPVTAADRAAEEIILRVLKTLTPAKPIVAEESVAADGAPHFEGDDFWLIDALDGTKEFIQRRPDFTVNIGYIHNGVPALGIVHAPARGETFVGVVPEQYATRSKDGVVQRIAVRKRPARVTICGSKSHEVPELMDPFLAKYDVADRIVVGSSMKFCMVATGDADLYPRFGPTCEWDTAAGDAVLRAAGGMVHDFTGAPLAYKKPKFLNGRFLAENKP